MSLTLACGSLQVTLQAVQRICTIWSITHLHVRLWRMTCWMVQASHALQQPPGEMVGLLGSSPWPLQQIQLCIASSFSLRRSLTLYTTWKRKVMCECFAYCNSPQTRSTFPYRRWVEDKYQLIHSHIHGQYIRSSVQRHTIMNVWVDMWVASRSWIHSYNHKY